MADAPERMTLQPCPTYGWDHPDRVKHVVGYAAEYVRADLFAAQAAELATLRAERDALRSAAQALGAMPEGYCFCSKDRIGDDSKTHEPECADLRIALKGGA